MFRRHVVRWNMLNIVRFRFRVELLIVLRNSRTMITICCATIPTGRADAFPVRILTGTV